MIETEHYKSHQVVKRKDIVEFHLKIRIVMRTMGVLKNRFSFPFTNYWAKQRTCARSGVSRLVN